MNSIQEEKSRAIFATAREMIDTPYEVTEAKRVKELQQQAAEIRTKERPEGRYTIEEAIVLLLAETGEYIGLGEAVWNGHLISYPPSSIRPIKTKGNDPKNWTSYKTTDEVCWHDLNVWLDNNYPLAKYKFPKPEASAAKIKPVPLVTPSGDDWTVQARAIADECFDTDTKGGCRDSLARKSGNKIVGGYSFRVMELMQERGIKGARGIIDNPATIMREALQGEKWWANKSK